MYKYLYSLTNQYHRLQKEHLDAGGKALYTTTLRSTPETVHFCHRPGHIADQRRGPIQRGGARRKESGMRTPRDAANVSGKVGHTARSCPQRKAEYRKRSKRRNARDPFTGSAWSTRTSGILAVASTKFEPGGVERWSADLRAAEHMTRGQTCPR